MGLRKIQTSFVSGELSPSLFGRVDHAIYQKAAAKIRNCYITSQGGVFRREGLRKIFRIPADRPGRLIGFEFNTEQVYLVLVNESALRVFRDDALTTAVATSPVTNITAAMLEDLNWTQSADTLLLFHEDLQSIKVTRTSHTVWTAATLGLTNIPTYDFGSGAEPVISASRGWPRCGAFKGSRLWQAGLKSRPQTALGSVVGDYFNYDKGTAQPDEAIDITIDDDRVNAIINMFPGRSLQLFTTGGEFTIAGSLGDPVIPEKISEQLKKATLHGCNVARPVSVDGATIFVEESGHVVREFVYNDAEQSYNATNISQLSPHLVRNPKRVDVRKATEEFPADYVYFVNEDGTMAVLNIQRDESLLGWSLFETDGRFEDVAVVGQDVYVIVQRFINGSYQRFIEKLDPDYKTDCAIKLDAGSSGGPFPWLMSKSTKTAWDGLDHLNGAAVRVLGDDYVLGNETVVNGAITSSEAVTRLEVGLDFRAELQLLPISLVIEGQDWAGQFKRWVSLNIRLLESRGVLVEQSNGRRYKTSWSTFGAAVLNVAFSLFTGWKKFYLGGFDRDSQATITQDDPLEFKVLACQMEIGVS